MPKPRTSIPTIVRGDAWTQTITFSKTDHTFSSPTTTVTSRMYRQGSSVDYKSWTLTPVFASGVTDAFSVEMSIDAAGSTALTAGVYEGDVVVSQSGYGPYTVLYYVVAVESRSTP